MAQQPPETNAKRKAFNTWIIGGDYSKTTIKKHQLKSDIEMKKRLQTDAAESTADRFAQKCEKRLAEMKSEKEHQIVPYVPKVRSALREQSPRESQRNQKATTPSKTQRSQSPPKETESPLKGGEAPPDDVGAAARALRRRLQMSFEQTAESHRYGTLFPPLLSPYNRPLNFLRHAADRKVITFAGRAAGGAEIPPEVPKAFAAARESFSVLRNNTQRVQPLSGPRAFLPTGSATTAYRIFTNFASAPRSESNDGKSLGSLTIVAVAEASK